MNSPTPPTTNTIVWARSTDDTYHLRYDTVSGRFMVQSNELNDPLHGTEFLARTLLSFLIGCGARTEFRLEIRRLGTETKVLFAVIHHGKRALAAICLSPNEPNFGRRFGSKLGDVSHLVLPYRVEPNPGKLSEQVIGLCALTTDLRARNRFNKHPASVVNRNYHAQPL